MVAAECKSLKATVSLGSNIRPRREYLARALALLSDLPLTRLVAASGIVETEPVDVPLAYSNLKFLNQVAVFETGLGAHEFARLMHGIEYTLNRVRTVRNGPRTIDIDLITFGNRTIRDAELTVPHPRAEQREFVMVPLRSLRRREIRDLYVEYVNSYRHHDGTLPDMMQLKFNHTLAVEENARLIAEGEHFSDQERHVSLCAAILHDTGRYEQLKRYNTFRDSESVDHAEFSHHIVLKNGWLSEWGEAERDAVLSAVLYHNRRDLPEGLAPLVLTASKTVRDADKLDIFNVLEHLVSTTDWRTDTRAFWNLQVGVAPNPEVVGAIRSRQPVDYQNIKSLADFVLIQIGWMLSGLYYETSRRLCAERGHLEFRRKFLRDIGGGEESEQLCDEVARSWNHQP